MVNLKKAKKRLVFLVNEIEKHNHNYYVLNKPVITDFEYDILIQELEQIEKLFPELKGSDSPTQKVGSDLTAEFEKMTHKYPMMSLSNTYSLEELNAFFSRVEPLLEEKPQYVCELKYDGASISLGYKNGRLDYALTRGDGVVGDNVINNVKTIKEIPHFVGDDVPANFIIRGEIMLQKDIFNSLNNLRAERGEALFANPRNAAAGTLKTLDAKVVSERGLTCFLYYLLSDEVICENHFDNLVLAREWGFNVPPYIKLCNTHEEVYQFIAQWDKERENLPFETDGVVVKINSLKHQRQAGYTAKSPRWAIAYKFSAQQARTKLLSIDYQVGRTGAITPVANLDPVLLAGTTVKRASLHNADQILLHDIRVGDIVLVEKGGEIIPKIVGVDKSQRVENSPAYKFISQCPECGTNLIRPEGEAAHYCPNEEACPPQIVGKLVHFTSRKAMDIEGMGDETVETLFQKGIIRNVADIYDISFDKIIKIDRMAEKSANNLVVAIEKSKQIPFSRVLFALGIRYVGETVARKLVEAFHSIDNLIKADKERLLQVGEIGDRIADSVIDYFSNPKHMLIIERLKAAGLKFDTESNAIQFNSDKLAGKSIVISGVFSVSRDEIKNLIEINGGKNLTAVSAKTSYLLAGANPGPEKVAKAEKSGVTIIDEVQFRAMLEN
ncbi:MAG: DNA ligase (NAD(+)) LigA [Bacteroidetes bacterium HGW-Bacteroidetes-21]|jgi:DNA ligase (NAD+)|nr:MAG: DNA ligase (NAD(+)) LigA [Bacteroidetes bacterium HGW-Bacteroidetes-21]